VLNGVTQGSVLVILLFILYTNHLPSSIMHSKTVVFAAETTICGAGKAPRVFKYMNKDSAMLCDWFKPNTFSVNTPKTKYIVFGTHTYVICKYYNYVSKSRKRKNETV